ncbi:CHAT domain-containing protein [Azospirillum halopraeferens]|uniref:CHAT domain-containing protein n=1 Tax=Azospirillum halopraeferens TaxID=34010 RepID=UPI0004212502|nr:CHAT domain-containing protein [Azospirillum halopraeferens]
MAAVRGTVCRVAAVLLLAAGLFPAVPAAAADTATSVDGLTATLSTPGTAAAERAALLLRRADAHRRLGFVPRAAEDFRRALAEAEAAGDGALVRRAHAGLGNAYLRLGEREAAHRHLDACAGLSRSAGDAATGAAALVGLGVLHDLSGDRPAAERAFAAALEAADAGGRPVVAARAALNAARLALDTPDGAAAARPWLAAAAARLAAAPDDADTAMTLVAFARLDHRAAGGAPTEAAHGSLVRAAEQAERRGDRRTASFALGTLGGLYESAGRTADARALTARAAAAAVAAGAPESLYLWEWQAGRLAEAAGDGDAALGAFARAVEVLDTVRGELAAEALPGPGLFREVVEPVYLAYADALLRRAGPDGDPVLLRRARAAMEQLKAAELEDYFKDDCVAALESRTRPIDRLAPRTAALYPILLPDRTELLVSIGDDIRRVTVPVGRTLLAQTAGTFRQLLEKRSTHQYREPAQQLYDWLMRPLEGMLEAAGVDTLVVVPDGPLRAVPLGALHDGRDFLAARYAVPVSPGLTLVDPRPLPRDRVETLLAGLSVSVDGYPALPQVRAELERIAALYPARVLLDEDFRAESLAGALRRTAYTVVHIASHGEVLADHSRSFLLTHDGRLTLDRLEALVKLGRFRSDPVELLVLSACRTAAGDDRAALGLAGVAIKAGARSALASLWYVSDDASAELMQGFYATLRRPGMSKAMALAGAQRSLMADPRFRHPYYWSAFLLIGNWL